MKVGFFEKDITPPLGTFVGGYFTARYGSGIKEKLRANSVVVESDGKFFSYTAVDSCSIPADVMRDIIDGISEKTGIPTDNVLVSATHNHTGTMIYRGSSEPGADSIEYRVSQIIDSAVYAYQKREEAVCYYGYAENHDVARIRNFEMTSGIYQSNPPFDLSKIVGPIGKPDPSVHVLFFKNAEGRPLGALTNYACHCDCVHGSEFSGDFPAVLADNLKDHFGAKFVSVYMQGACGNVNARDINDPSTDGADKHVELGNSLTKSVLEAVENAEEMKDCSINALREEHILKIRELPEGMLENARQTLIDIPPATGHVPDFNDMNNPAVVRTYALRLVTIYDNLVGNDPRGIVSSIQAIRFGDCYFYGVPGELFNQYAFHIKENAPTKRTFIAELSQPGYNNYIAIPLFYESDDVYEGKISSCWLEKGEGQRIAEKAVEIGKKL